MWKVRGNTSVVAKEYSLDSLFSYALWYTGKYRISTAKLREKLESKTQDGVIVEKVLSEIEPYHNDITELKSAIETLLYRAKPLRYVRNSLRQKGFRKEDIEMILCEFPEFDAYEKFSGTVEKRIQHLIER